MTNEQNTNAPAYHAFTISKGSNDKNYWTRIGAAWENKDGNGLNVELDCLPIDGKLTLRLPRDAKS